MLPAIKLGNTEITRLIIGGNPISGNSHVSPEMDREMEAFFTMPRIQETLWACQNNGINAMQMRADKHIVRAILEFRQDGGAMHWIAQTAPEYGSLENNLRLAAKVEPVAVYFHGSTADNLYAEGQFETIRQNLRTLRLLGVPVGLCTHRPDALLQAEAEDWGADFYMACVYNIMKRPHISSALTGRSNEGEPFDEPDRAVMFDAIRRVHKPVLAFKILGATRRCTSQEDRERAFAEAYASIKDTDACIVGMFPKYSRQVEENAACVRALLVGSH